MSQSLGLAHFFSQTDEISRSVMLVLALMSIASWYMIGLKAWQNRLIRQRCRIFWRGFASVSQLTEAEIWLGQAQQNNPFARMLGDGFLACLHLRAKDGEPAFELGSSDDFIGAALQRRINEENHALEQGLSLLATIGSTAPFVGLFGTVWGIYHALIAIGANGQDTLDKVAGPVGEALIMTACGLAVAIPAVLAYNDCIQANRKLNCELESFAHDVFCLLATGRMAQRADGAGVTFSPIKGKSAE